jgi:mono/diheme cytochrome c family protein
VLAGCGGGGDRAGEGGDAGAPPTTGAAPAPAAIGMDTAAAPAPADTAAPSGQAGAAPAPAAGAEAGGGGGGGSPNLTPQLVALGDSIFRGQAAGGTCYACHGMEAKGGPVAPDLTDDQWINIDGSYDAIVKLVHTGVPKPKQHPAPMPPMGGASLNDAQVRAVAAYVYSLSHGGAS